MDFVEEITEINKFKQESRLNLLFVCTGNVQRSPIFERWFRGNRLQYNVRSTGTAYGYPYRMTDDLLNWADKIFLMDLEQEMFIKQKFPEFLNKCEIIGCSDQYSSDSSKLKELIWYWTNRRGL